MGKTAFGKSPRVDTTDETTMQKAVSVVHLPFFDAKVGRHEGGKKARMKLFVTVNAEHAFSIAGIDGNDKRMKSENTFPVLASTTAPDVFDALSTLDAEATVFSNTTTCGDALTCLLTLLAASLPESRRARPL